MSNEWCEHISYTKLLIIAYIILTVILGVKMFSQNETVIWESEPIDRYIPMYDKDSSNIGYVKVNV